MENKGKKVQSVEKAMKVLDCFWEDRSDFSLAELSEKTGWAKSTIHALLGSMMANAMVEQDDQNGRYRLGYHAFELGCVFQERLMVRQVATRYMRAITDRTGESLYLGMRCDNHIILVENSESYNDVRIASTLGGRMPMYGSSQGKMILSQMTERQLDAYLRDTELKRYTQYTITTAEQLKKELNMIRVQGYAMEYSELRTGVKSIAAPIYARDGSCDFAISAVTMAKGSAAGDNFQKLQDMVIRAAADISDELQNPSGWKGR